MYKEVEYFIQSMLLVYILLKSSKNLSAFAKYVHIYQISLAIYKCDIKHLQLFAKKKQQ